MNRTLLQRRETITKKRRVLEALGYYVIQHHLVSLSWQFSFGSITPGGSLWCIYIRLAIPLELIALFSFYYLCCIIFMPHPCNVPHCQWVTIPSLAHWILFPLLLCSLKPAMIWNGGQEGLGRLIVCCPILPSFSRLHFHTWGNLVQKHVMIQKVYGEKGIARTSISDQHKTCFWKQGICSGVLQWCFNEHSYSYCLRRYLFMFMFMFMFISVHELTNILPVSIGSEYANFHTGSELK
jgi:hypothetical protein